MPTESSRRKTKKNINQDAIHTDSTAQQDYFVQINVSLDDTTPKTSGLFKCATFLIDNNNFETVLYSFDIFFVIFVFRQISKLK